MGSVDTDCRSLLNYAQGGQNRYTLCACAWPTVEEQLTRNRRECAL